MDTQRKIAEYGVPGDSFTIYATPEGHLILELINQQTTRIAMTAHFAEMMANDLLASIERIDPPAEGDRIRLDLTPQELCLLLAGVSKYVTTESVRLEDRPEMREQLTKDATALIRKVTEAMPVEGEDA